MKYIKLPLDLYSMAKGAPNKTCSLEESIAQYLMMQITCRYGEVVGKQDFGSAIWELEFNQLVKIYEWEETVRKSLEDTIRKYEKRIINLDVNVDLSEVDTDISLSKGFSEIRRQAIISVSGNLKHSGVKFNFNTTLFVSPLSQ